MELILTPEAFAMAALIFMLRVADMTFDTVRVLFVVRGRKMISWVLGFMQSAIFVLAISSVLSNVNNPLTILGYAAGFATGNVVGMYIEERLAVGHIQITIISSHRGAVIAEQLRHSGYAVTEVAARGKDGTVALLHCSVLRKQIDHLETVILENDPAAFITAEDVRPVRLGFFRA